MITDVWNEISTNSFIVFTNILLNQVTQRKLSDKRKHKNYGRGPFIQQTIGLYFCYLSKCSMTRNILSNYEN